MSILKMGRRSIGLIAILLLWQAAVSFGGISRNFLPSPVDAGEAFVGLLMSPEVGAAEIMSMSRAILGLCLATFIGIGLAVAGTIIRPIRYMIEPWTELLRPIPPAAIVPVAIFKLGIGTALYMFIITISAMWPIYLSTVAALTGVNETLLRTGRAFGCGRGTLLYRVMLPSALPEIFVGIRVAAGISLIATVVTEMLSGRNGIGYLIFHKAFALQIADVIALTVICGINGIILTQLVGLARILATGWHVRMVRGER